MPVPKWFLRLFLADFIVSVVLTLIAIIMRETTLPFRRIVPDDDPSLSYPKKDAQVPTWLLGVLCWVVPALIGFIDAWAFHHRWFFTGVKNPPIAATTISAENEDAADYDVDNNSAHQSWTSQAWVRRLVRFEMALIVSLAFTFFFTQVAKTAVGRPRPNFYALCHWDSIAEECEDVSHAVEASAFSSFPSGHTSLCFGGLLFTTLFLLSDYTVLLPTPGNAFARRPVAVAVPSSAARAATPSSVDTRGSSFDEEAQLAFDEQHGLEHDGVLGNTHVYPSRSALRFFIAMLPTVLAAWVGITRLQDYWHSYADVLAGAVLGGFIAFITFRLKYPPLWHRFHRVRNSEMQPLLA